MAMNNEIREKISIAGDNLTKSWNSLWQKTRNADQTIDKGVWRVELRTIKTSLKDLYNLNMEAYGEKYNDWSLVKNGGKLTEQDVSGIIEGILTGYYKSRKLTPSQEFKKFWACCNPNIHGNLLCEYIKKSTNVTDFDVALKERDAALKTGNNLGFGTVTVSPGNLFWTKKPTNGNWFTQEELTVLWVMGQRHY